MEKEQSRNELSITLNWNVKLQKGENNRKNFGYVALSDSYHELRLDDFFNKYQRSTDVEYNINNIFKNLLFSRTIYPSSKHRSFIEYMPMLFEKQDFSVKDMFRCFAGDENKSQTDTKFNVDAGDESISYTSENQLNKPF